MISTSNASATTYSHQDVARLLGWVSAPNTNLCQGYYSEPPTLSQSSLPAGNSQAPIHISYAGPGVVSSYGISTINKEVEVSQPGRIAKADKAIIYRNSKTGKIDYIRLEGHVEVREKGRLVAGPYSVLNLSQHTLEVGPAVYHLYEDPSLFKLPNLPKPYDAWGTSDKTFRDSTGIVHLTNASYTTCSPVNPTWQIAAGSIVLNQKEGFGTAYNMTLRFFDVPLMYAPLYSFPIDNRRKTGFLTPDPSYQSNGGFSLALPYYWNLAPNYDLTTTPKFIQERGFQLNSLFRYLSRPGSEGEVYLSFDPDDPRFNQFRRDTLSNPPTAPGVDLTPYLNDLHSYGDFRGFLHLQETDQFNEFWRAHIQLNYVTDDYYFQDFGSSYADLIANQLPNQLDVEYQSKHWGLVGFIQGYQTLHIIGQAGTPAFDQYTRIPELDVSSDYADIWRGVDFSLAGQSVNFAYNSIFQPTTLELPIGERLHLRPTLSRQFTGSSWYFTPQISLDSTSYAAQLPTVNPNIDSDSRPSFDASRNLPIVDVDTGLYLDHAIRWDHYSYLATLEPRLFYLYVPFINQNKYPNFDSELLPFTYPQLFDVNRFTSYDRLENSNQFSLGLTSRVLNSNTSEQKLKLDLGMGFYLESPKVCLDPQNCFGSTFQYISPNSHVTPFVTQLTYYPWINWSLVGSFAYDLSVGATNNGQVGVNYNYANTYVFTTNYLYVRNTTSTPVDNYGLSNSTNLVNAGGAWTFTMHWSALAYAQYNFSKERPDSYYGGFQYDACCWMFRFIASRSFQRPDTDSNGRPDNIFRNAFYVQIQLKSLGSFGTSASSLLSSTLSSFADPFK